VGILVEGRWQRDDELPLDASGAFVRPSSGFRSFVGADASSDFPAEAGRYVLLVAYGCPWAHRTILYRALKGLEGVIAMIAAVDMGSEGWFFSEGLTGERAEELAPVGGALPLHRVYAAANPRYTGRVTVPVLWDTRTGSIVNNESSEIIRMFDAAFDALGARGGRLLPPGQEPETDALNARVYAKLNNGVYRAGFARSQSAYDEAARGVFEMLDELEARLDRSRYLMGDRPTEADFRLLPTLVRFDVAYFSAFKCNLRRLDDYANLSNYTRDLVQLPGVADTVRPEIYRRGYHSIPHVNPSGVVPIGPVVDFARPHDRASRSYARPA
jgi:glutathionyl-hydroquinone reductase